MSAVETRTPDISVETAPPSITVEAALSEVAAQDALPMESGLSNIPVEPVHPSTLFDSEHYHILSDASVNATAEIFPEYINTAIIRHCHDLSGWIAIITMAFPKANYLPPDCSASLAISCNKVEYLAMTLFNVHIEADEQTYGVIISGGARVSSTVELTLQNAQVDAVRKLFGPYIFAAISGAVVFRGERQRATVTTACVSMRIPSKITSQAYISLELGLQEAIEINKRLYLF